MTADKIDYLLIKDFLPEEHLKSVWTELEFLYRAQYLLGPELTGSASVDGTLLKQNRGVFLDKVYKHPRHSPIMHHFSKRLFDGITEQYAMKSLWNKGILKTNACYTLVNYYENEDYYKPHDDSSVCTALLWLWKEPRSFIGGDFTLLDTGEEIKVTNNTLLMFPGHCFHQVSPVKMLPTAKKDEAMGRWCLSTFFLLVGDDPDAMWDDYLTEGRGHHP